MSKKKNKNKKSEKSVHPLMNTNGRKGSGRVGVFFNRWLHTMQATYKEFLTL